MESQLKDLSAKVVTLNSQLNETVINSEATIINLKDEIKVMDIQHGKQLVDLNKQLLAIDNYLLIANNKIAERDKQIIELKAKLFDLLVKHDIKFKDLNTLL